MIERDYLTEYDMIIQKDKEDGKDFNMLAYNDLKRAQYFFKYVRETENQYKAEPDWREKEDLKDKSKIVAKPLIEKSVRAVSLDVEEEELFKSKAQSKAEAVLAAAKPE